MPAEQVLALHLALAFIAHFAWEIGRLTIGHRHSDGLGHVVHYVWFDKEASQDLPVEGVPMCRLTGVRRVACGDVGGLVADSVRVPEVCLTSFDRMQRHALQRLGQLDDLGIFGGECPPAVPWHEIARQYDLIPLPVWIPPPRTWHVPMVGSCVRQRCQTQWNVHDGAKRKY
jgi:hypothetical protein